MLKGRMICNWLQKLAKEQTGLDVVSYLVENQLTKESMIYLGGSGVVRVGSELHYRILPQGLNTKVYDYIIMDCDFYSPPEKIAREIIQKLKDYPNLNEEPIQL